MNSIEILQTGMFTLVVDRGRHGCQSMGISEGGPADYGSCLWANLLCGNQQVLACLEVIGCGMSFTCNSPCAIAITGGVSQLSINNKPVDVWCCHALKANDQVQIQANDNGLISYVAIQGGFEIPLVFGSCTTVVRDGLGGLGGNGSLISKGDKIPFTMSLADLPVQIAPDYAPFKCSQHLNLRVIEGYQYDDFTAVQRQQFFNRCFIVSAQSNRMATRFTGKPMDLQTKQLYSEGITRGAVQLPPEGLPIVMLSDRQTIGGYPKFGTVLSIDCDKLVQSPAGTQVTFEPIDIHQAHNLICLHDARIQDWRKQQGN